MRYLRSVMVSALVACGMLGTARAATILSSDPLVPTGLSVGDSFRFVFVTSDTISGTSTDIATYNNFVQAQASALSSVVKDYGWTWSAIVSVRDGATITSAKTNTSTVPAGGGVLPIYRVDGVKVVDDYAELWTPNLDDDDPGNSVLQNPINVNQAGNSGSGFVWTGTEGNGSAFLPLGDPVGGTTASYGSRGSTTLWLYYDEIEPSNAYSLYAMSEPLTVVSPGPGPGPAVPEIDPASFGSVLALVLGSLGVGERRRVRKAAA